MANLGRSFDFLLNQMRAYQGSLAGGSVEFFRAGTTLAATVWLDVDCTQIAANPYMLSADGVAYLFGNGYYRIVVKNAQGVTVFDFDNVECKPQPNPSSSSPTPSGTGSVQVIIDCSGSDDTYDLTTDYNQYITRTGNSAHTLAVSPSAGKEFYNQQGNPVQVFYLYGDGETVQFLYDGTVYYAVIG